MNRAILNAIMSGMDDDMPKKPYPTAEGQLSSLRELVMATMPDFKVGV